MRLAFSILALIVIGGGLLWVFTGIEKDEGDLENLDKDAK